MNFKFLALTFFLSFSGVNAMNRKVNRQLSYPQLPFESQEIDKEELLTSLQNDLNAFGLSEEQKEQIRKADLAYASKNQKTTLKARLNLLKQETMELESYSLSQKVAFVNNVKSLIEESKKHNIRIYQQTVKLRQSIITTFWSSPSEARRLTPKEYRKTKSK